MKGSGSIVMILALVFIAVLVGAGVEIREQAWTDGYCSALGGERIARYTCEVDGRVVRV